MRLALSCLALAAAVGCATSRTAIAPTPVAVAPGAQQASHELPAAPDRSLAIAEYVAAGFPASDRHWLPDEYARAGKALATIAAKDRMALPRRGSQRSGEVFARMASMANLDVLEDRLYPLQARVQGAFASMDALAGILKIYLAAHIDSKGGFGAEILDLGCLMLHTSRATMGVVEESPAPEPGSAARLSYETGLRQIQDGLAEAVQGAFESSSEPYPEADRTRFAACLADEVPLTLPHLTAQGRAEARQSAKRALETERSSNVQRELIRLDAALSSPSTHSLVAARKTLSTRLVHSRLSEAPYVPAPPWAFRNVQYPSAAGMLRAYLTPDPGGGRKLPAIIWITGGDLNSIGDVWRNAPETNDQTAAAYRKAGLVMMVPSLRGGNDNSGKREGFLGEVDDVIAAHAYLSKVDYVDPSQIYLGGHSTGGTLVLLVAEVFDGFKAVFSFGPVEDVRRYGRESNLLPYDLSVFAESKVRSPGYWMDGIRTPTWIIEGDGNGEDEGNIESLRQMRSLSKNAAITWAEIQGATHFSTLAPLNAFIATRIFAAGPDRPLSFSAQELNHAFATFGANR